MAREPTREERIEACIREIAKQPDFPAFSHHIQQVMQVLNDEDTSLRRLTALILRDYSLTLKVLRTANTVHYNRSGRPILSVSHAVVLLGAEAIRCLVGSMALFEHFRERSPGLRELMLLSLLTANQARAVAAEIHYPRREEAYLCGMFRNLGEVLVANYFPSQYATVLKQIQKDNLSDREACFQVFGFTYEDLGQAVAKHWNLPEQVTRCIRSTGISRPVRARRGNDPLAALTSFSHSLTTTVYRREPEGGRARLNLLISDYLPVLALRKDAVAGIVDAALLDTKQTFALLRVPLDELRLSRQAQAAVAGAAEPEAAASPPEMADLPSGASLLEQLTHEVEVLLDSPGEFRLNNVLLMVLEAIYRGGPFDRVLFCLVSPEHDTVQGRLALGEGADTLREKFRFPLSPRGGVVGAALRGRRNLFLPGPGGASHTEVEMLKLLGASSLGLLPVLVDGILMGCLYFDRLRSASVPDPHTLELLGRLRDLTAVAFQRSRTAAAS